MNAIKETHGHKSKVAQALRDVPAQATQGEHGEVVDVEPLAEPPRLVPRLLHVRAPLVVRVDQHQMVALEFSFYFVIYMCELFVHDSYTLAEHCTRSSTLAGCSLGEVAGVTTNKQLF